MTSRGGMASLRHSHQKKIAIPAIQDRHPRASEDLALRSDRASIPAVGEMTAAPVPFIIPTIDLSTPRNPTMTDAFADTLTRRIDALLQQAPVVPVLAVDDADDAVPLAETLVAAGLPVLEITLRTAAALEVIRRMRDVPGAIVGAGTVLTAADLAAVQDAGAAFAISPGATDALYDAAKRAAIPLLPGIATASELMRGLEHGWRRFKFFPAEASGGIPALKSFAGPFAHVKFCPTGGIDAAKAPAYLALPNVLTVGGSWMVPNDALRARDWGRIGELARAVAGVGDRRC